MNKSEKKLIKNYNALGSAEREMLLSFSEFLAGRSSLFYTIEQPLEIERPPEESIVAAVKRLSASYTMLDKSRLLAEVSDKVTQTVVHGREVADVIDELEEYFLKQYQVYVEEKKQAIASRDSEESKQAAAHTDAGDA